MGLIRGCVVVVSCVRDYDGDESKLLQCFLKSVVGKLIDSTCLRHCSSV